MWNLRAFMLRFTCIVSLDPLINTSGDQVKSILAPAGPEIQNNEK